MLYRNPTVYRRFPKTMHAGYTVVAKTKVTNGKFAYAAGPFPHREEAQAFADSLPAGTQYRIQGARVNIVPMAEPVKPTGKQHTRKPATPAPEAA